MSRTFVLGCRSEINDTPPRMLPSSPQGWANICLPWQFVHNTNCEKVLLISLLEIGQTAEIFNLMMVAEGRFGRV